MQKSIKIVNHIDGNNQTIKDDKFIKELNNLHDLYILPLLNGDIETRHIWDEAKHDTLFSKRFKDLPPLKRCSYEHYEYLKSELEEYQINETGWTTKRLDSNHAVTLGQISRPGECNPEIRSGFTSIRANVVDKLLPILQREFGENMVASNRPIWYKNIDGVDGYMGWHTNHFVPEKRWYLIYNTDDNSSFFRYIDHDTGEMITHWEPKGWSINYFEIGDKSKPLWHCLLTKTNRFSFGFKPYKKVLKPLYISKNGWNPNDIPNDIPEKELRYKDDVKPNICKSGSIVDSEYDKTMLGELIYDLLYIDDTIRSSWDEKWIPQRDKLKKGYQNYNPVTGDSWRDSLLASWTYPRGSSDKTFAMLHPHSVPYFTDDGNRKVLQDAGILHTNLLDNNYDVEKRFVEYSETSIKPFLDEKYKFINNVIDRNYCDSKGPFECLRQLNLFSWDLPSIHWLKSKIYNNLKEWFPYIEEDSYMLGWCNIIKNNHQLVWHTHYDRLGLQNHNKENIPLSTNVILCPPRESKTWTEFYDPEIGRWKIPSEPGTMMSFDSRILHVPGNTDKMKDDEFRISLAMDIINPNIDLGKKKWHLNRNELYSTRLSTVEGLLGKHNEGLLGFLSEYNFKNNRDRDRLWKFLEENSGYIKLKDFKKK